MRLRAPSAASRARPRHLQAPCPHHHPCLHFNHVRSHFHPPFRARPDVGLGVERPTRAARRRGLPRGRRGPTAGPRGLRRHSGRLLLLPARARYTDVGLSPRGWRGVAAASGGGERPPPPMLGFSSKLCRPSNVLRLLPHALAVLPLFRVHATRHSWRLPPASAVPARSPGVAAVLMPCKALLKLSRPSCLPAHTPCSRALRRRRTAVPREAPAALRPAIWAPRSPAMRGWPARVLDWIGAMMLFWTCKSTPALCPPPPTARACAAPEGPAAGTQAWRFRAQQRLGKQQYYKQCA